MNPKLWGPNFWYILHIVTFSYPKNPTENDKNSYRDFFNILRYILPCDDCKKHYTKYITQYPITPHLDSKANLIKWLIQIHNFVNISLGKPTYEPSEVLTLYSNLVPISPFYNLNEQELIGQGKTKYNFNYKIAYTLIVILAIIIIFIKHTYHKNYYYY